MLSRYLEDNSGNTVAEEAVLDLFRTIYSSYASINSPKIIQWLTSDVIEVKWTGLVNEVYTQLRGSTLDYSTPNRKEIYPPEIEWWIFCPHGRNWMSAFPLDNILPFRVMHALVNLDEKIQWTQETKSTKEFKL